MSSKKKDSFKPWLSRPAINRSVTIPFTTSLTHRLSSLGEFHPNELDPFLLFDARDSMIGTLENPTLDLDPSKPDTLNVITATRAGTATFTDANGLIASASPNTVRVDQTQGAELTPTVYQRVKYTDFSSGWTANDVSKQSGNGYLSEPSAIITVNSTSSAKYYYFLDAGTYNYDTVYTGSFFIRRVSGNPDVYIDNFRSTSSESTSISLTDDWQKIEFTFTSPSDYWTRFGISFGASNSSVGDQVEIAQPQVEEGTTASDFVANTTGSPLWIASPTFGPRVPMIVVEPSSVNLVTYSEDFSQWTSENATIQSDVIISPSGSQDGSKMVSSNSVQRQGINKAQTQSGDLAFSLFAKKGEYDVIQLTDAVNASSYANFNLTSGTVGSYAVYTPKIEPVGNDWFRCSVTFNSAAINKVRLTIAEQDNDGRLETFAGNGADGLYIWGAQLEAGSLTSLIPTAGSTVTRAADDLVISGSAFSSFYNQSEGTVYAEFVPKLESLDATLFNFSDGSNFNRIMSLTKFYHIFVTTSGNTQVQFASGSVSLNNLNRLAASFKTNDCVLSLNGSSEVVDSSMAMPSINQINIGARFGGTEHLQGHIRRLLYWPVSSDSL